MTKLLLPLSTLITAVLLSGCGAQSASVSATPASPATLRSTSTRPTTPPAATSSPATPSAATPSAATTTTGSSGSPAAGTVTTVVPSAATQATFSYVGPTSAKRLRVTKTVTGATYQRLAGDLEALKPLAGSMQCNVLTGESATITLTAGGHTTVFTVAGSPCRGVTVTRDDASQPGLTGSMTLVNQVRAIAGFTGFAHPLTG